MPSHVKEKEGPLPENVPTLDIEANDIAHHYAGQATCRSQIPDAATTNFLYYATLIMKIQRKLPYILLNSPNRKVDKKNREAVDKKPE